MARDISSRLHLWGTLVTQSPLHVGGLGEDVDTDLPLARDGAGQIYVPGTSLAGALRELGERLFGEDFIDELWGYQREDRGHASFVVVDDAIIGNGEAVEVEVRDHVGIDREYGSAAESIKYDRAILPRGTNLTLRLSVDVAKQDQRKPALAMLAALQQALEAGEVRLGAAKTRGLGHIKLVDGQLTEQIFGTRQGILASLQQANGAVVSRTDIDDAKKGHPAQKRPRLILTIKWKPVGPLMVKVGFDGIAADMLPLVSGCDGQISLVLPGSSVKGAFRGQAERIVRTLRGDVRPKWLGTEKRKKFLDAVEVKLINELFGQRGEKVDKDDKRSWLPGLGALGIEDCYGKPFDRNHWLEIVAASEVKDPNGRLIRRADEELERIIEQSVRTKDWQIAYHVAIDRWLGSAAEGMLYSVLEPHRTDWEPLTLEVNLQRLPDDLQRPAIALLVLVIRDLANNRLPLGFATHRGMGTVHVERVEIVGVDLPDSLQAFGQLTLSGGRLSEMPADLRREMNEAWQQWVKQNQEVPA